MFLNECRVLAASLLHVQSNRCPVMPYILKKEVYSKAKLQTYCRRKDGIKCRSFRQIKFLSALSRLTQMTGSPLYT